MKLVVKNITFEGSLSIMNWCNVNVQVLLLRRFKVTNNTFERLFTIMNWYNVFFFQITREKNSLTMFSLQPRAVNYFFDDFSYCCVLFFLQDFLFWLRSKQYKNTNIADCLRKQSGNHHKNNWRSRRTRLMCFETQISHLSVFYTINCVKYRKCKTLF